MIEGFDPEFAAASDWARLYRANGVQVVPARCHLEVKSDQAWKCPLLPSWREFQNELVSDETFDRWYGPHGQYVSRLNMGTLTGRCSGNLFVIDLDIYKTPAALAWWIGLLEVHNNGLDLETVEQVTGGGGTQKLFRAPANWIAPTNKTSIGIDIRGQGGFAMLAPSLHESGNPYHWVEGRSPDDLPVTMAPAWLLEEIEKLIREHGGGAANTGGNGQADRIGNGQSGQFDAFGHQTDGRETKMRDLVWGAIVDWYRECPIKPSEAESLNMCRGKYEVYEGLVSPRTIDARLSKATLLEAEGRGSTEFWGKWQHAMGLWETKVREEARKPGKSDNYRAKQTPPGNTGLFEVLNVDDILAMPDPHWLVDKLVVEQALGFIYGPPGCLKTFIALDMALSFTTGQKTWWNRGIERKGAVVYISSEGQADLKFRLLAWEKHRGTKIAGTSFRLIRQSINFMDPADIGKLLATVEAIAAEAGPIAAVFVDTVSRVLPGAEENLQKDMSLFIAACDAVRQRFAATVFGLHHTSRNGNMRGSTVMPGAGDFIIEVRREPGAMSGSIFAFKIKAAEDGWEQPFKVTKVTLSGIIEHTSLMVDPVDVQPARESGVGWPDIAVCREILQAIDEQWLKGQPWCFALSTSRSVVTNVMKRWGLKRTVVLDIVQTWTAQGMIEEIEFSPKTHVKGYRKVFGF